MKNASHDLRLEEIRGRLEAFKNAGVSWRVQVMNPYVSSSTIMQEMGSHPEKVMGDLLNHIIDDLEFLLNEST